MSSYMVGRILGCLVLLAIGAATCPRFSYAADYSFTSCDPALVQAGEVVLLSLTGNFPPGELTVEFFPQRINVLSTDVIDRQTLAVQVNVPPDAPAGKYNILVYSASGEEALGDGLFEVQRKVRAPKISSAAPLEVDAGLAEVKLTLRCDILDSEALPRLRAEWTSGGKPQDGVTSSFARGGVNAINLTINGAVGPGIALGKVYFDSTPIYLIKLTRVSTEWSLFGHRPARVVADSPGCEITLLGAALTPQVLKGAKARLVLSGATRSSADVEWIDLAKARASFSPIPVPGEYSLEVEQAGVVVYQGPLLILAPREADSSSAEPAPSEPATPTVPATLADGDEDGAQPVANSQRSPSSRLPAWEEAEQSPVDDTEVPAEVATPGEDEVAAPAVSLAPDSIDSGKPVFRLELLGLELAETDLDHYLATLQCGDAAAQLMFMGSGAGSLILLFTAPEGGWVAGQEYRLLLGAKEGGDPLVSLSIPAR